jgi:hypothetical protein
MVVEKVSGVSFPKLKQPMYYLNLTSYEEGFANLSGPFCANLRISGRMAPDV